MNNEQLIALNPITLPKDISVHKIAIIVMKKLSVGQVPHDIMQGSSEINIQFTDKHSSSLFCKQYRGDQLQIPIMKDGKRVCRIDITMRDMIFRVTYDAEVYAEPDDQNPFLRHIKTDKVFKLKATSYLRYKEDETGDDLLKYCFPTGDDFYSYIRFFEQNIGKFVKNVCMIQDFNNPKDEVTLSIADFSKMCKNSFMLDKRLPSMDSVNLLIDDLIYMDQSGVERIQAGILRIVRTTSKLGTYKINFGGTILCNEQSIKRFKYMFHPGLQMVAKHLEFYSKGESLRHKIEKEMFKQL